MRKYKKILLTTIAASCIAAIVATSAVACGSVNIDKKLRIDLNDNGQITNNVNFKQAVKEALKYSSSTSATFKKVLVDEILFQWFTNRMSANKDDTKKNSSFWVKYDEWETQIKKDYDNLVQTCKDKYRGNYTFYLQNEYLSPNGGSEATYKHRQMVLKIREEVSKNIWLNDYFSYNTNNSDIYPNIFSKANSSVDEEKLNNPNEWSKLGFYASSNSGFVVTDPKGDIGKIDTNQLARNPEGDYATIQQYTFDRWFRTEKPFFSAASLFKYSNPKFVADKKLSDIYNGVSTGTEIPSAPTEAFPFFGGSSTTEKATGTRTYYNWFKALEKGEFQTKYTEANTNAQVSNGTVTIGKNYTEDSQTLLLSTANNMFGPDDGSLYLPYAAAAGSLYFNMFDPSSYTNTLINTTTQENIGKNMPATEYDAAQDNFAILSNFMFGGTALPNGITGVKINSATDLHAIYDTVTEGSVKRSILFKNTPDYNYFYGTDQDSAIRFVTNSVEANLGKDTNKQKWVLELNQSGVHAQTIDGLEYVEGFVGVTKKNEALKNVVKYRLMQKKSNYNSDIISANVLGSGGQLNTYFTANMDDIILEMAFNNADKQYQNVWRNVEDYKKDATGTPDDVFTSKIAKEQGFVYENLKDYFVKLQIAVDYKKQLTTKENINNQVYNYRKGAVDNSKNTFAYKTIYANGLLAQLPFSFDKNYNPDGTSPYDYVCLNRIAQDVTTGTGYSVPLTRVELDNRIKTVNTCNLITDIDNVIPEGNSAFSPMIKTAKSVLSNRFWYKSAIVDNFMFLSLTLSDNSIVNKEKMSAYDQYIEKFGLNDPNILNTTYKKSLTSAYYSSKLLTTDKPFNFYSNNASANYFSTLDQAWTSFINTNKLEKGEYSSELENLALIKSTMAWLITNKDEKTEYANFYKVLNTKVNDNEQAVIGYLNKTNSIYFTNATEGFNETITDANKGKFMYNWSADVNNIYDQVGYHGGTASTTLANSKLTSDSYWKVIDKKMGKSGATQDMTLAGFTGLQTKNNNSLDSESGLKSAVFDKLSKSSCNSSIITGSKDGTYEQNTGAWFNYEGSIGADNKEITFPDVIAEGKTPISSESFKDFKPALKLAKKIADMTTMYDLKTLAADLGNSYYGNTEFKNIGNGQGSYSDVNSMRYAMLAELLLDAGESTAKRKYEVCFNRLDNCQVHEDGSATSQSKSYLFKTANSDGYRFMLTQINKADIIEKRLHPKSDTISGVIDSAEFYYLIAQLATDSSIQKMAVSDIIEKVYEGKKLDVYDASTYNNFGSIWIKDWNKKTIGS